MTGMGHNSEPVEREGNWIAISRDLIDHHIVGAGQPVDADDRNKGTFSRLESWLDLLCMANFKERRITAQGATIILTPGQTLAGRAFLAKRWNWTEKTVRVWLAKLEAEIMITLAVTSIKQGQTKGHGTNVLTICNWPKFQIDNMAQGPDLGRPQGQPRASQGPHYNKETTKQGNKEVKEEGHEIALAADAAPSALDALRAFEAYNGLAQRIGLPVSRTLTPARRRSVQARMREHGGFDAWTLALANVERSAFLRGSNSKGWRADFDFLLQANRFAKVVDGTYGNGAHGDTLAPKETELEKIRRLVGQAAEHQGQRRLISHE